ncbi:MAG: hypothetical protein RUDDFDWM_001152 [Candidatus Fervidibacterota bacterium]
MRILRSKERELKRPDDVLAPSTQAQTQQAKQQSVSVEAPLKKEGKSLLFPDEEKEIPDDPQPIAGRTKLSKEERELVMQLRREIHERVIVEMDRRGIGVDSSLGEEVVKEFVQVAMQELLLEKAIPLSSRVQSELIKDVIDEVIGYGPIQPLLDDPTITEVMVNHPKAIFYERGGRIYRSDRCFDDEAHVMRIIDRIVSPLGRQVNERMPMVDARLPDGSRVNIIIPPLAVKGPCITIRKFSKKPLTITDLINFGTLTEEMAMFLEACVRARLNIIVSGGTGSGKTTTLNVLSHFIPPHERVITIEDAAELQLDHEDLVTLEARPPNIEGVGEVTIRDLVRNALRMRPDRIVVGEVRGPEALDMLQAMNTGHDGSLSTLHSNSPRDTISRLETMVLMAGMDLPMRAIAKQIASAIDIIVHQARLSDGSRKITHITEVQGIEGETIILQDIFVFRQIGIDENGKVIGYHEPQGIRPLCMERIKIAGINLPDDIFQPRPRQEAPIGRRW